MTAAAWVWAVIAGVFALITALSHLTKILEFFGITPATGLRARVILSLYAQDPLVHLFYEEWVNKDDPAKKKGTYWAGNARRSSGLSSYWKITVTNEGKALLKNVQITVPDVKAIRYELGYPDVEVQVTTPFPLGDMMPRQSRTFHAWSSSGPSNVSAKDIGLVHESGHGTVTLLTAEPFEGNSPWLWVIVGLVIMLPMVAIFLSLRALRII